MAWQIVIGEDSDADQITLDTNINLDISTVKNMTDAGTVETVDVTVDVTGVIASSTPSTQLLEMTDLTLDYFTAKRVRIQSGGSDIYDWDVSDCVGGTPQVIAFETIPTEGQGESDWEFRLKIFAKVKGAQFQGARTLRTSVEWKVNQADQTTEKIWRAYAEHDTAQDALATVRAFNPGGTITKAYGIFNQQNAAQAVYTWQKEQQDTGGSGGITGPESGVIVSIEEEQPQVVPLGPAWLPDEQASENGDPVAPELVRAAKSAYEIRIRGLVRARTPDVPVPEPHYSETEDLVRDRDREVTYFPVPDPTDINLDRWMRNFEEVWIWTSDTGDNPPAPANHGAGGHLARTLKAPPGDGAAAGTS